MPPVFDMYVYMHVCINAFNTNMYDFVEVGI
jgi:hypothetical protein